jgi:hypothetical protein
LPTILEIRRHSAALVFNAEDRFARARGTRGPHPRPFGPVRFYATAEIVGLVRNDFPRPVELVTTRTPAGFHLFFGETRHADGSVRRGTLAEGTYAVRAEGRFYQRVEREDVVLPTPGDAYFYDLPPSYAYPLPREGTLAGGRGLTLLRGALVDAAGRGLAGTTVEVVGLTEPYLTDGSGQWVLVFPDATASGPVTVRFTLPDASTADVANVQVVRGAETGLAQTALRGWVLTQAGGVPAGAVVEVLGQPGSVAAASDGGWFYYFGLNQAAAAVVVRATLPGGQNLTENNVLVQPRSTVVVPTFRFP